MFGVCSIDNIGDVATTCCFTRTQPASDDADWEQGISTTLMQDYQFARRKNLPVFFRVVNTVPFIIPA